MSFVNLMASDIWTEADILNRTEAIVRNKFNIEQEAIMNRKLQGASLGQYTLTEEDKQQISTFNEVVNYAKLEGDKAREDMKLLNEILRIEPFFIRLRQPLVESFFDEKKNVPNQEDIDKDLTERNEAETILAEASAEAMELLNLRNPEPAEETKLIEERIE